jgi:hypothetical protein
VHQTGPKEWQAKIQARNAQTGIGGIPILA